ncbi:hypothetical protein TC41_2433 [Alicyclobacillus acidocaldarius subsp. acidocaldarius Tc-4-1]|uniref:Uncharacterized protein n=1 Tax=Alicyclobacillus acidocaldarius (strain Tc-4-1) TaxID=1048834 RepID=F8IGX8_ALIAT|nr:hypothetical protein TC41_2433 [Alicyclobacillus acidocaldarius subsp. acidocaldarius Tc-4-1]
MGSQFVDVDQVHVDRLLIDASTARQNTTLIKRTTPIDIGQ